MADLAPQFASLQGRLGALGAAPVPPPGPPGAPVLAVPPVIPALPAVPAGGGGVLSSPWLWVAIAVLLLAGLYFWYNSQKKKKE